MDLKLPKFTLKYAKRLNSSLQQLGIQKAFSPVEADLSNITDKEKLNIDYIQQFTFLNVDEEGAEAAASTMIEVTTLSKLETVELPHPFHVNRPFILFIEEKSTGSILFMGKIMEI